MAAPRLRSDLEARPTAEDGLHYFDVRDPRSGALIRMYEHEWLLAQRMDGSASLPDVARWAEAPGAGLGFSPSTADLAGYAQRLADLGFFDEPFDLSAALSLSSSTQANLATPKRAAADETDFGGLDDERGSTADVRPDVIAAVRSGEVMRDLAKAQEKRDTGREMQVVTPHREPTTRSAAVPPPPTIPPAPPKLPPAPPAVADLPPPPTTPTRRRNTPETLTAVNAVAAMPRQTKTAPTLAMKPLANAPQFEPPVDAAPVPSKSRAGLIAVGTLGLIGFVGGGVYFGVIVPALKPVPVKVQAVGAADEVLRYYEGKGTVSKLPPETLSFGTGGHVIDMVGVGVETKPGMTLASLDTYASMEKELADVRDRANFYENALRLALAKHHAGDAKKAQAKVDEKKRLLQALEEKVGKSRIIATSASTVAEVLVASGADVVPGAPVLKLADKRTLIEAKLSPAEAKSMRVGEVVPVTLVNSKAVGQAKVLSVGGDGAVKLDVTDDAGGVIKSGAQVQLVKSRMPGVTRVLASAVVKSQGGADQVFVYAGGIVKARLVTVAERTGTTVYVSAGIAPGDQVVTNPSPTLADSQKATTE